MEPAFVGVEKPGQMYAPERRAANPTHCLPITAGGNFQLATLLPLLFMSGAATEVQSK